MLKLGFAWERDKAEGQCMANIFPKGDNYSDRIQSFFTNGHLFGWGYAGKHPVAWKEYCA